MDYDSTPLTKEEDEALGRYINKCLDAFEKHYNIKYTKMEE